MTGMPGYAALLLSAWGAASLHGHSQADGLGRVAAGAMTVRLCRTHVLFIIAQMSGASIERLFECG
jgi:hypothetical protein